MIFSKFCSRGGISVRARRRSVQTRHSRNWQFNLNATTWTKTVYHVTLFVEGLRINMGYGHEERRKRGSLLPATHPSDHYGVCLMSRVTGPTEKAQLRVIVIMGVRLRPASNENQREYKLFRLSKIKLTLNHIKSIQLTCQRNTCSCSDLPSY